MAIKEKSFIIKYCILQESQSTIRRATAPGHCLPAAKNSYAGMEFSKIYGNILLFSLSKKGIENNHQTDCRQKRPPVFSRSIAQANQTP
jgi:hypothetical protein